MRMVFPRQPEIPPPLGLTALFYCKFETKGCQKPENFHA